MQHLSSRHKSHADLSIRNSFKAIKPKTSQDKWLKDCSIPPDQPIQWQCVYSFSFEYTKCTRLLTFHFNFLHRRLATNTFLSKIGIKDTDKCSFCGDEPESIVHLFWSCQKTSSFWNSVTNWLLCGIVDQTFRLNCAVALGLRPSFAGVKRLINFCLLIARYFIWKCKYNQKLPDLPGFICLLKTYKELDHSKNALTKQFWEPLNKWL